MKVLNLCLLIVASAAFLLVNTHANAVGRSEDEIVIDNIMADMEMEDGEYMDFEAYGFLRGCAKVIRRGYKGLNGTKCLIEEVAGIMLSCTGYLTDIEKCTVNVPKDVLNIVNTVKKMTNISSSIIHLNSQLCAADETSDASWLKDAGECSKKLVWATFSLTRRMSELINQSAALPPTTSSCYLDATHKVVNDCNNFVPNLNRCIDNITN
ncbi:hypothetical protein KR018_001597 [Drosophila ironensis]|nr:hypothetical protein KR018_001597 [Drosophila ironensis]